MLLYFEWKLCDKIFFKKLIDFEIMRVQLLKNHPVDRLSNHSPIY